MKRASIVVVLLSCLAATAVHGQSQGWSPSKPMRMITPFAAAGSVDLVARMVSAHLATELGTAVVVENRPGANGVIAVPQAARAEPDGHTLLFVTTSVVAVNPALYKNLPYDIARDFTPVGTVCETPMVLIVNPAFPAKNLQDVIAYAKAKPDAISYASSGVGVFSHLVAEMLKSRAGIKMVHIPYKGEAPALQEMIAGRVPLAIFTFSTARPMIEAGQLRALGVPSAKRLEAMPDVPTFSEQGLPDFDPALWYGVVAPKGTPPEAVTRINRSIQSLLAKPETRQTFARQALIALPSTPEEMAKRMSTDLVRYGEIVRAAAITVD